MGSWHTNPLCRINRSALFDLIIDFSVFPLYCDSQIDLIFQNSYHHVRMPYGICTDLKTSIEVQSAESLILHRRQYSVFIQMLRNRSCAVAFELHIEDHSDHIGRVLINNQMILVFRIFHITVCGEAPDKLSVLPFHVKLTSDFHGKVTAVGIIDKVFEGYYNLVSIAALIR